MELELKEIMCTGPGKTSWFRSCETEAEALALAGEPQQLKHIGKKNVKVGKEWKKVKVLQGEFRRVVFDKASGKWGVSAEEATLDEKQIEEREYNQKLAMEVFKELYKKSLEKGKRNGKTN